MALELINENKIGEAKGTAVEDAVQSNFLGETAEVGLYLAMAWQAHREGYPEVAAALESISRDEAQHAADGRPDGEGPDALRDVRHRK